MPRAAAAGHKFTPFDDPTHGVQKLFDDLGTGLWPGLAWERGDPAHRYPGLRRRVLGAAPGRHDLFAEVGSLAPAAVVTPRTISCRPSPCTIPSVRPGPTAIPSTLPSAAKSAISPTTTPFSARQRVGEPVLMSHLNAGLWVHAMRLHVNHQFVVSYNGVVSDNPLSVRPWGAFP